MDASIKLGDCTNLHLNGQIQKYVTGIDLSVKNAKLAILNVRLEIPIDPTTLTIDGIALD